MTIRTFTATTSTQQFEEIPYTVEDLVELPRLHQEAPLTQLNSPNPRLVSDIIKHFLERDYPFTNLNSTTLLISYKSEIPQSQLFGSTVNDYYLETGYRNVTGELMTIPRPHIYQLTTSSYFQLRRMGQDQSIVFSGVSGSGKSTSYRHTLKQLTVLGAPKKKSSQFKIGQQLLNAFKILQLIGSCHTENNTISTKFGLYQEIQFNRKGRLVGFKTIHFYLESSRVLQLAKLNAKDSSFLIFHWLLGDFGKGDKELAKLEHFIPQLKLDSNLQHGIEAGLLQLLDDEENPQTLNQIFKTFNLKKEFRLNFYKVIISIALLIKCDFYHHDEDDFVLVKNQNYLEDVAELLGVQVDDLELVLVARTRVVNDEVCTMMLDLEEAQRQRDQLCTTLFRLAFSWIVEAINAACCKDEPEVDNESPESPSDHNPEDLYLIGLLDYPGYSPIGNSTDERGNISSFDDFCTNFINETMQAFMLDNVFSLEHGINKEMGDDGIVVPDLDLEYHPNTCLHLLRGDQNATHESAALSEDHGLLGLFSHWSKEQLLHPRKEGRKYFMRKSWVDPDTHLYHSIQTRFQNHPALDSSVQASEFPTTEPTFVVRHFFGNQEYSVLEPQSCPDNKRSSRIEAASDYSKSFLDQNIPHVSPDFIPLFRDRCDNWFVQDLFYHPTLTGHSQKLEKSGNSHLVDLQLPNEMVRKPGDSKRKSQNIEESESRPQSECIDDEVQIEGLDETEDGEKQNEKLSDSQSTLNAEEPIQFNLSQLNRNLSDILTTLENTQQRHCIHLMDRNPKTLEFDEHLLRWQIHHHFILQQLRFLKEQYLISLNIEDGIERYQSLFPIMHPRKNTTSAVPANARERLQHFIQFKGWSELDCCLGDSRWFLSEVCWKELEDGLRRSELASKGNLKLMETYHQDQDQLVNLENDPDFNNLYQNDRDTQPILQGSHLHVQDTYESSFYEDEKAQNSNNKEEDDWANQVISIFDRKSKQYHRDYPDLDSVHDQLASKNDRVSWFSRMSWFGKGQNQEAAESPDSFANEDGEDASKLQVWKNHPRSSKHLSVIETQAKEEKPKGPLIRLDSKCNRLGTQPIKAKQTNVRKWWVRFVWLLTFWIPSFLLRWRGMNHSKIRMAWREKVTLCALIAFLWGSVLFLNIGLAPILCPKIKQFTPEELSHFQSPEELYVGIHGKVYDITPWAQQDHAHGVGGVAGPLQMAEFGGKDISNSFPIPLSVGCIGLVKDESMKLRTNLTRFNGFVHDVGPDSTLAEGTQLGQANWFRDVAFPKLRHMHKGELVYKWDDLKNMRLKESRQVGVIGDRVFDLTDYFQTLDYVNTVGGATSQVAADYHFLDSQVEDMFHLVNQNIDMTNLWNSKLLLTPQKKAEHYSCLLTEFYIGKVDNRDSFRCVFTGYMLYAMAWIILGIVLIKFLASLQLGSKRDPQNHQKFVICQVPCYTEGEEGLRKNINSLTCMDYSDHHKLLFIITDGMIIGSGNDRPTPKIVLDILGVDESSASEVTAKSFISVGEGNLQHNMAKVYSGLYEYGGHKVPFLVVVKVGAPGELIRPGNRGKRDSQVVLLRFLNKVFFDREMNPLELEIYHQLKNVIGVPPHLYEYILMIDADTQVAPDALTRLVACMHHDAKIAGICGETQLANPEQSLTTMIQIYEYFISHHMSKAFESLFGSVTCLPGCFCLYRIRTPIFSNLNGDDDGPAQKVQPLIISDQVIDSYSVNLVDTLHDKNLLMLGEDRYLTTLMLKYFPRYKLKFTSDARCKTIAPDQVKVLISQRRRWINSTVHNLWELMGLRQLCGVCLVSLRFVVFIDLFGTLVMPAMIGYLIYLIYHVVSEPNDTPGLVTVITLAAIYGSQVAIFVLKRKWSHVGWMIVHTFALPLFYVFLPIYSFWHFDDFSWGNTRRINGQKPTGKGHDQKYNWDTEFDPSTIPLMRWSDYERTLPSCFQGDETIDGNEFQHDEKVTRMPIPTELLDGITSPTPQNHVENYYMDGYSAPQGEIQVIESHVPGSPYGQYGMPQGSNNDLQRSLTSMGRYHPLGTMTPGLGLRNTVYAQSSTGSLNRQVRQAPPPAYFSNTNLKRSMTQYTANGSVERFNGSQTSLYKPTRTKTMYSSRTVGPMGYMSGSQTSLGHYGYPNLARTNTMYVGSNPFISPPQQFQPAQRPMSNYPKGYYGRRGMSYHQPSNNHHHPSNPFI